MTALRLTSSAPAASTPAASHSPRELIPIQLASQRSGLSVGHLSRKCRDLWAALGKAELRASANGGKPQWMVDVGADPALAKVKFPDQIGFDLRSLTAEQRAEVNRRKKILDDWQLARAGGVALGFSEAQITAQFLQKLEIEHGNAPSRPTLFRWRQSWRAEGIGGLVDGRACGQQNGCADNQEFFDCLKNYYLSTSKPSAKSSWLAACLKAREQGWPLIGYRSACLFLQRLPAATLIRRREGADAFTALAEPSIERDYTTLHSNEQWVGDHHQFDVILKSEISNLKFIRPWLTAWMDMRSRKIVGWCITAHDPNSSSILSALRAGILCNGAPEMLYIDGGKDFGSYVFHGSTKWQRRRGQITLPEEHIEGILNYLQIKSRFCLAYHGQSKPIERLFGTIEDQFGKTWPTYCGPNTQGKPEELSLRLARNEAPTLAEFIEKFSQYLEVYHNSAHEGDGLDGDTPAHVYDASWGDASKRTASAELLDLLLMRQTKPAKVSKRGVTYNGLFYGAFSADLIPLLGREVYLRVDERDLTRVQVWTADDRFVCIASANQRLPANASDQELRSAIAEKRGFMKLQRQFYQKRPRITEDLPDLMIRARQAAAANLKRPEPVEGPPLKPIRSALEGELEALRDHNQPRMKIAAGAENVDGRFIYLPAAAGEDDHE